jgi:hypothetical protein
LVKPSSKKPTDFFRDYPTGFSVFPVGRAGATGELIYSGQLSFSLKCDVARQMLQYPATLEKSTLLAFSLKQIAANSPVSRTL